MLISIRPRHARRILSGIKRYEFRRRHVRVAPGTLALIYETSPTKAIVGTVRIEDVIYGPGKDLVGLETDLEQQRLVSKYLAGACGPTALRLSSPAKLHRPVMLYELQVTRPPQSYMFVQQGLGLDGLLRGTPDE